ncbi:hypothetical protein BH11VER1_BH11VER1_38730 [soil metagenome]
MIMQRQREHANCAMGGESGAMGGRKRMTLNMSQQYARAPRERRHTIENSGSSVGWHHQSVEQRRMSSVLGKAVVKAIRKEVKRSDKRRR